jgi:uncharacterized protein (DUF305 family)
MPEHSHAVMKQRSMNHYGRLAAMIALSFVAMFGLMYSMVNSFDNVYANFNQFYMAGLMTAAMVVIELGLMGGMYPNKKINAAIAAASLAGLIAFWLATRQQAAISDTQFLRSMIPHHGGAILMCQRAPIQDADIKALCQEIMSGQQSEIIRMKAKLRELRR